MVMLMLMEMVLTALAAVLLSFLVAKLVSAVVGGGGDVKEPEVVIREGVGRRVVGEKAGRVVADDRCEEVKERCISKMLPSVVYGFGKDSERVGGGNEEVESAAVEEDVGLESRLFAETSESGLMAVEEIGGVVAKEEGGSGGGFGDENVVRGCLDEVVCSADGGRVDEMFEDKEGRDEKSMDVEIADSGTEEKEMDKELKDEEADQIEECIRNIVNEECKNEFKEFAEAQNVVDCIGLVIEDENRVTEGIENQFKEMEEPKDVANRIGEVIEEEHIANEGYKNQGEEAEGHKFANVEVTEERSGSSGEDDDWEGIEMSELYNEYKSAAAIVRNEEKNVKFSNTCNTEMKMQLYGLQKIVMEGPCREAQPMAIKMSARAKWNAWQRLGNMNPEDAMKQYIALVSGLNPRSYGVDDQSHNIESTKVSISDPDQSNPQNGSQKKKELTCIAEGPDIGSSSL